MRFSSKTIGLFSGPLLFLLFSQQSTFESLTPKAWDVLGVAAWMITWWITEAAPLAVSSLLPIILFPSLGVFDLEQATAPYASSTIFLFMGGFFVALGIEEHGLHKRIALCLVKLMGTSANGIILGFMLASAFLSMWVSNTATTIMMLPIASTIIALIGNTVDDRRGLDLFSVSLMLGIAYASSIGGLATIIGTPPNVVFAGFSKQLLDIEIDFSKWMLIGVPISSIILLMTYLLLTRILYRNKLGIMKSVPELIDSEREKLGSMSREESITAFIFALTAFLWIFKIPVNKLLGHAVLNDTMTAMIGGILMFVVPASFKKGKGLVSWEATSRLPWGILLLFGGGITLAKAMESSGLIQVVAGLVAMHNLSPLFVYLVLIVSGLIFTELMSNVALATIYIPLVIGIAEGLGLNPLLLSIPVVIATSCAFMLPVATPPNAIVFSSGRIEMNQMVKAGFFLNIFSVGILMLAAFTIISRVFG